MSSRRLRLSTGIVDQSLSSLVGLAVAVAVARSVSVDAFGAFALAQAAYYLALGVSRSVTAEPFTVRFSGGDSAVFEREARSAAGAALVVATAGAGVCVLGAAFAIGPLRSALLALSITLPVLLLHDFLRFAAYSQARGHVALVSDLAWAGGVGLAMFVALASGTSSVGILFLAWGAPAALGLIWSSIRLGVRPDPRESTAWWRAQRELAPRYLGEFVASSGAGQAAQWAVGAIAGLAATGALRAGLVLLGPLNVLFMGTQVVAVPEAVTLRQRSSESLLRFSVTLSAALTVVALLWGVAVLFLPDAAGRAVLGDSWDSASAVAPILALSMAASGVISGAFVGLRALAAARTSLRVRTIAAPAILGGCSAGAYLGDARGAAVGLAAAMWFGAALWWRGYVLQLRATTDDPQPISAGEHLLVRASDV